MTHAEILALLLSLPIPVASPAHEEEPDARRARLESIAHDFEAEARSLPGYSRTDSTLLALAVAYHESGFALDVDIGPCWRGPEGKNARCDAGRARCLFQIQGLKEWPSRRECIRIGSSNLRRMKACDHLPRRERLAILGGSCSTKDGRAGSLRMFALFDRFGSKLERIRAEAKP